MISLMRCWDDVARPANRSLAEDEMRVLVCGGRDFKNWKAIYDALDALPVETLIEGGAPGADLIARDWAMSRLIPVETYEAEWERDGNAAGPIRNRKMLTDGRPDLVLAFPGGPGTSSMIRLAKAAGVDVKQIDAPRTSR
jgi:YspA, cpYpsA-related SLOG family